MSVVSANEMFERRRSAERDGVRTHVRQWKVNTDDDDDGPFVAINASGIPREGDVHPQDGNAIVISREAQQFGDHQLWFTVIVEYSTDLGEFESQDPLEFERDYRWSTAVGTESYFQDRSNAPKQLINTAGERFANFLTRESGELQVTIASRQSSFDVNQAYQALHKVNTGAFSVDGVSIPAGVAKISAWDANKNIIDGTTFYDVSLTIKFREEGWKHRVESRGFNSLTNDDKWEKIRDPQTKLEVTESWPLNVQGQALLNPNAEGHIIEFQPYAEMSYAGLGIF